MKQTLNRTLCSLLAAAALAAGLSACAPLVVGGAVVGTMMAVGPPYHRHAGGRRGHRAALGQSPE